ncbi:MAG: hypothetical protein H7X95_13160 [Deltaproteobacteria bacterium]|nr:hypothetical protein [Deltaproteobacteria bacterium]
MPPKMAFSMRIAIDPTTYRLMRDVSAGIRVLQTRDGVDLSESLILERARNIVMGLLGNYRIEEIDREQTRADDEATEAVEVHAAIG